MHIGNLSTLNQQQLWTVSNCPWQKISRLLKVVTSCRQLLATQHIVNHWFYITV